MAIVVAHRHPQLIDNPALVAPRPGSPRPTTGDYGFTEEGLRKFRDDPANDPDETLETLFDSAMEVVSNVQRGGVLG